MAHFADIRRNQAFLRGFIRTAIRIGDQLGMCLWAGQFRLYQLRRSWRRLVSSVATAESPAVQEIGGSGY